MTCKNCDHNCHCSDGGSCCGGQCECKDCNCKSDLEKTVVFEPDFSLTEH
jgi:hypothetical protein